MLTELTVISTDQHRRLWYFTYMRNLKPHLNAHADVSSRAREVYGLSLHLHSFCVCERKKIIWENSTNSAWKLRPVVSGIDLPRFNSEKRLIALFTSRDTRHSCHPRYADENVRAGIGALHIPGKQSVRWYLEQTGCAWKHEYISLSEVSGFINREHINWRVQPMRI